MQKTQIRPTNDTLARVVVAPEKFSENECRQIVEMATSLPELEGQAQYESEKFRDSKIVWFVPGPQTQWVFDKLVRIILDTNKSNYNFELTGIEAAQVSEYRKGAFYDWHMDLGVGPACFRKVSISVQLSSEQDYEGGDLEFFYQQHPCPKQTGSVILFPSYMEHRVAKVTRGVRRSLVAWAFGPPLR